VPQPPGQSVMQLRVTLEDIRPVIWRRLLVPGGVRLAKLHSMFQAVMGWNDTHLHQFRIDGSRYGMQFDDYPEDELDEASVTVIGALRGVRRFFYDYDFGDDWNHEVVVEDIEMARLGLKHGVCLDGQRSCPPEDVGGPPGYENFLAVLADPSDGEHQHFVEWSGGDFDPERFSVAEANIALQKVR
jgi:hypothetical protein